jgi:hypothetical protein
MFAIDPGLQQIHAARDQIVTLLESINRPHVAVPGKQAQQAQAFVVGFRRPSGDFAVHVYLWLTQTGEAVVYSPEQRVVPLERYREAELEAAQFCESMGFMTEPVGFRDLAPEAQDALLSRLPPFRDPSWPTAAAGEGPGVLASPVEPPAAPAPAGAATPEQLDKLGRLLGSF